MKYDFIEIGTADFDTEIQKHNGRIGISVDPIQEYLDNLPNVSNVQKVCCGISNKNFNTVVYKPDLPSNHPNWVRGCVSIIHPHKHFINHCTLSNLDYNNYMKTIKVDIISVSDFIKKYHIESVDYLKIDTEGHDCIILNAWLDECSSNKSLLPKHILFETKDLTDTNQILSTRDRLKSLNYNIIIHEYDTEAFLTI